MTAPKDINRLIKRFQENRDVYCSSQYNEAQARHEFIDPFFKALGWDMTNKKGYAEAYKEVIHEDAIKVGGATKAPDYAFRIGGVRKFFVEAKRPGLNIKEDGDAAYQLRRYAWSAKLPLSIVTDFEEFAVYDSRIKPAKTDKPSLGRVLYLTVDQYDKHWDEIAQIFSQDAILTGSFDKYVQSSKKKRGTAEVDTAFLNEIEAWRELLARNIALRNAELSTRELNYAVQRTIDRIIFLRICEDRGIEQYGQLMALENGTNTYKRLCQIFRRADERYNSGLFHFSREKDRLDPPDNLTLNLTIDDKLIKGIIKGLYYPESPFEFSVLPADILGHIYEQFLGKVIRLTAAHHAKVEDKPEVKKAGGVYYTPTYIVDYIVKNTVGKLLEQNTPTKVSNLRILDPACGSGSFLLGAYQTLLDWHQQWYTKHDPEKHAKGKNPRLYRTIDPSPSGRGQGEGAWRVTTPEKKRILLNNIYGVDIDTQAVEVTKLSLLLKVLEGENAETLGKNLRLFHERALPDLGDNIKCGNSLIGPDFYEGKQLSFLDEEERYRINAFDWNGEFPQIMTAGGFDAVIGNPPYVLVGKDLFDSGVARYLGEYTVAQYKVDLFHLFIQHGIDLLAPGGQLGYIVPNPWLTLPYTKKLRQYVLENTAVGELVILDHQVFKSANVHTMVLLLKKSPPSSGPLTRAIRPGPVTNAKAIEDVSFVSIAQTSWLAFPDYRIETRLIGPVGDVVNRIMAAWPCLDDVARASLGCQAYNRSKHTPEEISARVFHATERLTDEYLPELAGSDVSRYLLNRRRGQWIKYGPWLHDYRSLDWLSGPRILVREIPGKPPYRVQATYLEDTYCNYKTILNVNPIESTSVSMKYMCGLLNSRLLSFLYPYISHKMVARTFPRLSVSDLRSLPIRTIDFSDSTDKVHHHHVVELVEAILKLHEQLATAKTSHEKTAIQRQIKETDRQIDQLVYELYDLTEEEIRIVEEATK